MAQVEKMIPVKKLVWALAAAGVALGAWLIAGPLAGGAAPAVWETDARRAAGALGYPVLDPAADRLYMIAVPIAFGVREILPWWVIALLIGREVVLAGTVPFLRSRGITALPTLYLGKAATFALFWSFPLLLAGHADAPGGEGFQIIGEACLYWGVGLYVWSGGIYLWQALNIVRAVPLRRARSAAVGRRDGV